MEITAPFLSSLSVSVRHFEHARLMLVVLYEHVIPLMKRAVPTFVTIYGIAFHTECLYSPVHS